MEEGYGSTSTSSRSCSSSHSPDGTCFRNRDTDRAAGSCDMITSDTLGKLESLSIDCRNVSVTADISLRKIETMTMKIENLDDLGSEHPTFIQQGHLTRLVIGDVSLKEDEGRLTGILGQNPALDHLHIGCKEERLSPVDTSLCMKAQDLQLGNLSTDDLAFIQEGHVTRLVIGDSPLETDEDRLAHILSHNTALTHFQVGRRQDRSVDLSSVQEMKMRDLIKLATSDTLCKLESMKVDGKDFSFSSGVSHGKIQNAELTVRTFDDLDSDDLKFILDDHLVRLAIKYDLKLILDDHLANMTNILLQCTSLSYLQIGCSGRDCVAIINLVISAWENALERGDSFSLHTLEIMDERLVPFDELASRDHNTHIQSYLSFSKDSKSYDMPIFNGHTDSRSLQLETLSVTPRDSLESGVAYLDNIITRSPGLKSLGLYVSDTKLKEALSLIDQQGARLSKILLHGEKPEVFSRIASSFPTRNSFPRLELFELWPHYGVQFPSSCIPWIMAMVSAPPRRLTSSTPFKNPSQGSTARQSAQSESESAGSWTPLRKIMLCNIEIQPEEWRGVIEAIDLSALEYLDLGSSNFSEVQFELLVDRFPINNKSKLPLRIINIINTTLAKRIDSHTLEVMTTGLQKMVPLIKIIKDA
ncbi:MAG: hypothetical protein J3Q66DRAFT_426068 [Benniella sp.]|nr:MAG: hypothetical protein J3Q66DRAFT_426068 [Benniella sp.]